MEFLAVGRTALSFGLSHLKEIALGVLLLTAAVQTGRLHHAKADLVQARGALVDPATRVSWQKEATTRLADLGTCHKAKADLEAAQDRQNDAVLAQATRAQQALQEGQRLALEASRTRASVEARARALAAPHAVKEDACEDMKAALAEIR